MYIDPAYRAYPRFAGVVGASGGGGGAAGTSGDWREKASAAFKGALAAERRRRDNKGGTPLRSYYSARTDIVGNFQSCMHCIDFGGWFVGEAGHQAFAARIAMSSYRSVICDTYNRADDFQRYKKVQESPMTMCNQHNGPVCLSVCL